MDKTVTVRPTTLADLAEIDALFARAYPVLLKPDYPPSILFTALPLICRAQPNLLASGTFFFAVVYGLFVGAGAWTPGAPGGALADRNAGHVRHLVTDQNFTRRGIGRALMARVFKTAEAAGMTVLRCQSTRTAVPFYQAVGFRVLGEITVPLRPGIDFPAVSMMRDL